ncbi:MAG: S-methyl-5-thioribose-1-phosphate isomerase [Chloroflexi bacterium]|nr:S-methyl-5-thioribose-1-phosphate isomerase [Chloroflexota bacterium]
MAVPPVIEWRDGAVRILDQRRLPDAIEVLHCTQVPQVMEAIRTLAIRGAPALGVAGAYGVALGAHSYDAETDGRFADHLNRVVEDIAGTRPTAVNLGWAARIVRAAAEPHADDPGAGARAVLERAHELAVDNDRRHLELAAHGASLLAPGAQVLHHCNTGPLATGAGFGSALGVIQAAHSQGKISVWVNETRPLLQGARLTTWELDQWGIPYTLITDSMAGHFMQRGSVDAVVVGADRIAANGDVANKIGTYTMAQLARAHGLPFIVAAPISTIDFETATGDAIPIEERGAGEVRGHGAARWAPGDAPVANPAFDVTPNELVSAIVTERGIARAPYTTTLAAWREPVEAMA